MQNFIPNVGTVVAVALPLPLVVLDPAFSTVGVLLVLLLPLAAHAFAGNVIEPLLFGHTLKLHPVTILISLLFWGALWGITGSARRTRPCPPTHRDSPPTAVASPLDPHGQNALDPHGQNALDPHGQNALDPHGQNAST